MLLMRYVLVISICLNYNSSLILENLVGKVLFVTPLWGLFRISFNLSNCTKFPRKLIFRFSKHLSLIEKREDIWNKNIKLKLPRFCKKKNNSSAQETFEMYCWNKVCELIPFKWVKQQSRQPYSTALHLV